MSVFTERYRELIALVYPPLAPGDGFSEEEVAAAERRLGLRLPAALRDHYLLAGRRRDVTQAQDSLILPDALEVDGGVLRFYRENQWVVLWGLRAEDAGLDDPPLLMAENAPQLSWEPTGDSVSGFLAAMIVYQATLGGLAYSGVGTAEGDVAAQLDGWRRVSFGQRPGGFDAFAQPGRAVSLLRGPGELSVNAGAQTREAFLELTDLLGADWYYSTLDDEEG